MKKALIGLTVPLLALFATTGPASAATHQVSQYRFNGSFAEALLYSSSAASDTSTYVRVSASSHGGSLVAEQFTQSYDGEHNITGATDTLAEVTSGFAFAIDQTRLDNASLTAFSLPATTCTYDADFVQVDCAPSTINLGLTWTGYGPVTHSTSASHVKAGGFSVTDHLNGTSRDATAAGSFAGLPLGVTEYAVIGNAVSGSTMVCIGTTC